VILACIWIGWLAYWVVTAFTVKRTIERGGWLGHRLVMVVIAGALLAGFRLLGDRPSTTLWQTPAGIALACVLVAAAGAAFAIWARIVLGRNWSAEVAFKQGHELIESGPYALVRHPIYAGILAMGVGSALDVGRPIGLALLIGLCGGFAWKAREEEGMMRRHFPEAYADYRRRVRAVIPFVL
jgi:protein-S-isoprenylcysteine O-methyltransferase Ste14